MTERSDIEQRLLYDLPDAINEAVKNAIPVVSDLAGKGWDLYIMGVRYDGALSLFFIMLGILILYLMYKAIRFVIKKMEDGDDWTITFVPISISVFIAILMITLNIRGVKKLIIPEVYIIQTAIDKVIK